MLVNSGEVMFPCGVWGGEVEPVAEEPELGGVWLW